MKVQKSGLLSISVPDSDIQKFLVIQEGVTARDTSGPGGTEKVFISGTYDVFSMLAWQLEIGESSIPTLWPYIPVALL